jgi:hypothetical protein
MCVNFLNIEEFLIFNEFNPFGHNFFDSSITRDVFGADINEKFMNWDWYKELKDKKDLAYKTHL